MGSNRAEETVTSAKVKKLMGKRVPEYTKRSTDTALNAFFDIIQYA